MGGWGSIAPPPPPRIAGALSCRAHLQQARHGGAPPRECAAPADGGDREGRPRSRGATGGARRRPRQRRQARRAREGVWEERVAAPAGRPSRSPSAAAPGARSTAQPRLRPRQRRARECGRGRRDGPRRPPRAPALAPVPVTHSAAPPSDRPARQRWRPRQRRHAGRRRRRRLASPRTRRRPPLVSAVTPSPAATGQPRGDAPPFSPFSPGAGEPFRGLDHLFQADLLVVAREIVVRRQEEHAVTLFALPHRHARAIPEALLRFRGFIVVVAAGAEGGAQFVLVLGEARWRGGGGGECGAGALASTVGWGVRGRLSGRGGERAARGARARAAVRRAAAARRPAPRRPCRSPSPFVSTLMTTAVTDLSTQKNVPVLGGNGGQPSAPPARTARTTLPCSRPPPISLHCLQATAQRPVEPPETASWTATPASPPARSPAHRLAHCSLNFRIISSVFTSGSAGGRVGGEAGVGRA